MKDVEFTSHGATLRGWLFQPPTVSTPTAAIVLAHGLSAVREMFLDRYGQAFADAGFTALVYDHFGFGASDGEPRQCPLPSLQMTGYRDAVRWLAEQDNVDPHRIGIWGTSFSGGEVVVLAAEDLPIRAAVAQVPALAGGAVSETTTAALREALGAGRSDTLIPATTPTPDGLGIMYRDGAHDWFARVAAQRAPSWRNEVRATGFGESFHPSTRLADAKVPLLLILAADETLVPHDGTTALAQDCPNVTVVEIPGNHFDAYETGFDVTSRQAIDWFTRHLGVPD